MTHLSVIDGFYRTQRNQKFSVSVFFVVPFSTVFSVLCHHISMLNALSLVRDLIALPAPPGEEGVVRDYLARQLDDLGYAHTVDAKGNLIVSLASKSLNSTLPRVLVTAHMDEIGLIVTQIEEDGKIRVAALGGTYAWKWGEGAVELLAVGGERVPGILSFGSIHTNAPESVAEFARHHPLGFEKSYVFTGKTKAELYEAGVFPGVRVALAVSRRVVTEFGEYFASYFLDDRVDLAVWLLALERLKSMPDLPYSVTFSATTYEEIGGEGARYILARDEHEICVALELGPKTPEADFEIDATPTIWVRDGYATLDALDQKILVKVCRELAIEPHWQYLSRGGSDASCASSLGLTARPVTLGFPVENSHGYEIMHRDAPDGLADLLLAYLNRLGA